MISEEELSYDLVAGYKNVWVDNHGSYWWSSESYDMYGPYHCLHEALLDELTYCHVELGP